MPSAASVSFVAFVHWSEARGFVSFIGDRRSGGDAVVFGGLVDSWETAGGFWTSCADAGRMPRKMMLTAIRRDILNVFELQAYQTASSLRASRENGEAFSRLCGIRGASTRGLAAYEDGSGSSAARMCASMGHACLLTVKKDCVRGEGRCIGREIDI